MLTPHTYRGTVDGASVKLLSTTGLPDGVEVDVTIKKVPLTDEEKRNRLESLFGSCQDDAESLSEFVDWNDRQRKRNRNASGK